MTRSTLLILVLVCGGTAQAQSGYASGDFQGTRPNAGGDPEQIRVRLGFLDIVGIDDREQVFTADLVVEVAWRDHRLALDDVSAPEFRTFSYTDIWSPRLLILNDRGLDVLLPKQASVDRKGNVIVRQRLAGPLAVDLDLRRFPFDTQRLPIEFVSYQYSDSELAFSPASELVANFDQLSGNGWKYAALEPKDSIYRLQDDSRGVAQLTFAVTAERDPTYYIFTLALPMTLILFLAWMTHWLPVDIIPPRMGTASATVFSLIAFGVSFRLTLPKISYLTDADRFVFYSMIIVLVSLAVTIVTIRWASRDRKEAARKLARRTRMAFPALYVLVIALTFFA